MDLGQQTVSFTRSACGLGLGKTQIDLNAGIFSPVRLTSRLNGLGPWIRGLVYGPLQLFIKESSHIGPYFRWQKGLKEGTPYPFILDIVLLLLFRVVRGGYLRIRMGNSINVVFENDQLEESALATT